MNATSTSEDSTLEHPARFPSGKSTSRSDGQEPEFRHWELVARISAATRKPVQTRGLGAVSAMTIPRPCGQRSGSLQATRGFAVAVKSDDTSPSGFEPNGKHAL